MKTLSQNNLRSFIKVFQSVTLFLFAQSAVATISNEMVICKNEKKSVRTINVKELEGNVFVTLYTRDTVQQEVARAKNKSVCVNIMGNIKENLKKAGWQCKEASAFSETNLNTEPSPKLSTTKDKTQ